MTDIARLRVLADEIQRGIDTANAQLAALKFLLTQDAICALCGKEARGYATVQQVQGPELRLCHYAERDCYHRWTVYGERRHIPGPEGPVGYEALRSVTT